MGDVVISGVIASLTAGDDGVINTLGDGASGWLVSGVGVALLFNSCEVLAMVGDGDS